jgi:uncharacterized protein YqjF (DUF2071 family)
MSNHAATLARLAPTRRPSRRPIGFQSWSNLLFLHWRLPADTVRSLLPGELTLDTWDGEALVGLVPFQMSGVRPWWSPSVPGVSNFCETNVRTYVHHRNQNPGVWFFSLEAASSLAVRIARWRWSLPYYRATMELERRGSKIRYASRRLWPGPSGANCRIAATIGEGWGSSTGSDRSEATDSAEPGTLDHFLIERYILYAQSAAGRLRMGRVHHKPYPLRKVRVDQLEETLTASTGLAPTGEVCHAAFSKRVDVEIFPLELVG